MLLWKVIGTILVVQFAMSFPAKMNECHRRRKLCGKDYDNFIIELCFGDYYNCPREDVKSLPNKVNDLKEVKDRCCRISCNGVYLKRFCGSPDSSTQKTTTEAHLQHEDPPQHWWNLTYSPGLIYY